MVKNRVQANWNNVREHRMTLPRAAAEMMEEELVVFKNE
jgi:hypothetical protein